MISLRVPSSKSETQRALLLAALAAGESRLENPLDCADSQVLRAALRSCGARIDEQSGCWVVAGGALRAPSQTLHCGEAGSALRFLCPLALALPGELFLDGAPRLRERPIGELLTSLGQLGVEVRHLGEPGLLPFGLRRQRPPSSSVTVDASRSSQFVSGLLLIAPLLSGGLQLKLAGAMVSRPYVELTLAMMKSRGAAVQAGSSCLQVAPGAYCSGPLHIGGDWSSAAFVLAAARISGRPVQIENLAADSAQGDRVIVELLARLAQPGPHRFDLTDCPDLLPPLAAAAALSGQEVEIAGIAHARLKESDRPHVLAAGFTTAGLCVVEEPDRLRLHPGGELRPVRLDPAGDHRMAMAFGLLSLHEPRLTVDNPGCVSKSYPGFWQDLERFR